MPNTPTHLTHPWEILHPLEPAAYRSNFVVSDKDTTQFLQMAEVLRKEIERLDTKIGRAPATNHKLLARRTAYSTRLFEVSSAIAPHKKLPVEVLSKIFEEVDNDHEVNIPPELATVEHPWNLGQVCSRWRQVLCDTPAIWNSVTLRSRFTDDTLSHNGNHSNSQLQTLELAKETISRGTRFLYIYFPNTVPIGDDQLGSLIIPFAAQFIGLSLNCPSRVLLPFLSLQSVPFRSLELLNIKQWDCAEGTMDLSLGQLQVFSNAPQLGHLSLSLSVSGPLSLNVLNPQSTHLRWGRLTSFIGRDMLFYFMDVYRLLYLCDNLETCCLEISCSSNTAASPFKREFPIELPHLHTLELSGADLSGALPNFFKPLTLPSLKTLKITANQKYATFLDPKDLADVVARSQCQLENFIATSLLENERTRVDLERFLDVVSPTLRRLEIPSLVVPPGMLSAIAKGHMFPKLEELHCDVSEREVFDAFVEVVTERWGHDESDIVSNIWSVGAHSPPWWRPDFWNVVSEFCRKFHEMQCSEGRNIIAF